MSDNRPNAVTDENRTEDTCPWCGAPIIWKDPMKWKAVDKFLACSEFPDCTWTSAKKKRGQPQPEHEHKNIERIRNGR